MSPVRVGGYALNRMEIGTSVDYIKHNLCLFFGIALSVCWIIVSFQHEDIFLEGYGQIQNKRVGYELFTR